MTQEALERELARRADDVYGAPLSLADVRTRARSIRRRRQGAVVGSIAAVVAVLAIAPAVLAGLGDDRSAPDPAPVPIQESPVSAYLADGTVSRIGAGTVPVDLDNENVLQLAVLGDGRILAATQDPYAVQLFAADGSRTATYDVAVNALAISPDGQSVAWVDADSTVVVLSAGETEPVELAAIPMSAETGGTIDAVVDAEHVLVGDGNTTTGEVTPDGYRELTTVQAFHVDDVSPDGSRWAVSYQAAADPQFGCSSLYDPAVDRLVAKNCTTSHLRFSPDGQRLLGMRGDNNTYGDVATYDLSLTRIGRIQLDDEVVSAANWSGSGTLLVATTTLDGTTWSLNRYAYDARGREVLVAPFRGRVPEAAREFVIAE